VLVKLSNFEPKNSGNAAERLRVGDIHIHGTPVIP
jgi:hypothetical protein